MSVQEKRRLERLKKELDSQQKKLDAEKKKHQRATKELSAEQNRLANQKREFNTKIKKFHQEQRDLSDTMSRKSRIQSVALSGGDSKLREELKDVKLKAEQAKKNLRETRKDLDASTDEVKILRRKLKHAGSGGTSQLDARKVKQARREIFNMKRRLKITLKDLDKQAKYYESQLRRFKLDEQKWIVRQREVHKEKNVVLKYVWMDDIAKIKLYKDNQNKVRLSTHGGSEVLIRDIEVMNATENDAIADEVIDQLLQEIAADLAGKQRKKRKRRYTTHASGKGGAAAGDKLKRAVSAVPSSAASATSSTSIDTIDEEDDDGGQTGQTAKKHRKKKGKGGENGGDGDEDSKASDDDDEENDMDDDESMFNMMDDLDDDEITRCFDELFKEFAQRTRDLHALNLNEDVEVLLEQVRQRHEAMQTAMTALHFDDADELPEMNKAWQDELRVSIDGTLHPRQDVDDVLQKTLAARNSILMQAVSVLNHDQPKALLAEVIENASQDEDEAWLSVLRALSRVKPSASPSPGSGGPVSGDDVALAKQVLLEMQAMAKDVDGLRALSDNDLQPLEELDNITSDVEKRHAMQREQWTAMMMTAENADSSDDVNANANAEELKTLAQDMQTVSQAWHSGIRAVAQQFKSAAASAQRNQYLADELNGRIADLLKLDDMYKSTRSTKPDVKALKAQFDSFVTSVQDRHQYNHDAYSGEADAIENDHDWKDNIFALAGNMTGLRASEVGQDDGGGGGAQNTAGDGNAVEGGEQKTSDDAFDAKHWWLDKDENRNDTVDAVTIDEQQQCGELYEAVTYLDRVLYVDDDDDDDEKDVDVVTSLYFPIPRVFEDHTPNMHNMIATLYDGVVLCKLMNHIKPGYIDQRCIFLPDAFNPFPISDDGVRDNLHIVLSCAKSMGIQLQSYDVDDWLESNAWSQYMIELVNALAQVWLDKRVGLHRCKELVRLVKNNEDADEARKFGAHEWLQRWINYRNAKPVLQEIDAEHYNEELFSALRCGDADVEEFNSDAESAAPRMISRHRQRTNVRSEDLLNRNQKLQHLFTADVFEYDANLPKLTDEEKAGTYKSLLKSSSSKSKSDDDTFTTWINSTLSPTITVVSLLKDLSSGYVLLKLLDAAKPDCVNWRQARKKIRHKFDKVNNCNMVMKLAGEEFHFSLVGMAGSDIVDMKEKFVHSLLSQMMRFYQTRQLSLVLFKNATQDKKRRAVTDDDILQWVNLKISECDEAQSKPLESFKDRVLSTCIFYIELLKAVRPHDVDLTRVNYDVKALINAKVMDKQKTLRTQNALYCMTMIRRFGGELFVSPHHVCIMDQKAILAVLAAIMTISITDVKK